MAKQAEQVQHGRAATDSDVYRMPYEGNETSEDSAQADVEAFLGSVDTEDPEEPETVDVAPAEAEADEVEGVEDDEVDDDSEPEPAPQPQTFRVKVEGQEVEVTLDELTAGYSRTSDYTKKTQALAEQRKQVEQKAAVLEQYSARLGKLDEALAEIAPPKPDQALRDENPAEYAAQWADYEAHRNEQAAVQAERQRVAEQQRTEQQEAIAAHLRAERERLLEAVPEWKDEAKAKQEVSGLVNYAKTLGFSEDDLSNVSDHRLFLLLRDAARYRELTTKGREQVQKKVEVAKVLQPGSPKPARKSESDAILKAKRRLSQTGRQQDAQALIEQMLGGG